jgi:hypothetical protein
MAHKALKAHPSPAPKSSTRTLSTLSTLSAHFFTLEIAPSCWPRAASLPTASGQPSTPVPEPRIINTRQPGDGPANDEI